MKLAALMFIKLVAVSIVAAATISPSPFAEFEHFSEVTGHHYHVRIYQNQTGVTRDPDSPVHLYLDPGNTAEPVVQAFHKSASNPDSISPKYLVVLSFGERDLPPSSSQLIKDLSGDFIRRIPDSGKANLFFDCIEGEILPAIEKHCGENAPSWVLHTYGISANWGFYVLFHHPAFFKTIITESPDASWHEAYLFRGEYETYRKQTLALPVRLVSSHLPDDPIQNTQIMMTQFQIMMGDRKYKEFEMQLLDGGQLNVHERSEMLEMLLKTSYQVPELPAAQVQ